MKTMNVSAKISKALIAFGFFIFVACVSQAHGQLYNSYSGGYNTGYGTVYGSLGYATATQNLYNSVQMQIRRLEARSMMVKQFGLAAVEKAEREARSGSSSGGSAKRSNPEIVVPAPPVVRNHGVFRPDAADSTGKVLAEALGSTPDEKALITRLFNTTRQAYEKEAASRGWGHNVAGGLTFFTVTAMTVYHDAEEPPSDAIENYFKVVNASLDEIPDAGSLSNKEKQAFNNTLVGFAGLLLAGYTEGKENDDASTLAAYRKLAGELIRMVLKMDPENLRLENGRIIVK